MTGIVILAAGSSSRLGAPKQNLLYKGQTLLQKSIETALASGCQPVIVVLGANASVIKPTIEGLNVNISYNADWHEGMASSIRLGIKTLRKIEPETEAAILMLCDQPFVSTSLLDQILHKKGEKGIIACIYNNTSGVPVLFNKVYFDELLLLKGHEGAKKLLLKYQDDVATVSFPLGIVDIDTIEDYGKI